MKAPELAFQSILRQHWEDDATALGRAPTINTGKYDRGDGDVPVISIRDGTEGPIDGGQTDYTAIDGAGGGGMQLRGGARTIDVVAGSYDDLRGAGANGENLNPKQLRWDMYLHTQQLLIDHQIDTDLMWVAPGDYDMVATTYDEGDAVETVFSVQLRGRYGYDQHPR